MLYLYGDESNTPGADKVWGIGFLFSVNPSPHMEAIQKLRKDSGYENRELKYSSTDYSQILFAIKLIEYFFNADDLYFKILIKDNLFFDKNYFLDNSYHLDEKDMAYVSAYAELSKSILPKKYEQHKKLLNVDDKGFRGNVILPKFLKKKDKSIVNVYRRNSKKRKRDTSFTGVSSMIQVADFLTGTILSFADKKRPKTVKSDKHKNIYRKAILSNCKNLREKCEQKLNYYWPSFDFQKINIFYWKCKKNASLGKSLSKS